MATQVLAADKIVIYAQELGSGLQESIEALHPESEIDCTAFNLEEWMRQFASNYSVGGIVLDTDSMGLGDLRTVAATIKLKPEVWCLMLVGDRGIAGFENFIELNNVLMLPKPWTPQGLRSCLANFYKSESGVCYYWRAYWKHVDKYLIAKHDEVDNFIGKAGLVPMR
ncbi:MAG: hypothetical protein QGF46_06470, partial [Planctomycetota bacterium]|nr:hypothetical protein [Planctomycetota bacterium]